MEIMKAWKQKLKQFMHMEKGKKIIKSSHFADSLWVWKLYTKWKWGNSSSKDEKI